MGSMCYDEIGKIKTVCGKTASSYAAIAADNLGLSVSYAESCVRLSASWEPFFNSSK